MPTNHRHAFTLVELAIVLAIIGLIAGAVVGGKALLNSSSANKTGIQGQNYLNAIEQFRTRYQALPGDMVNATQYWGAATCPNGAGTGTQTCNGNGDRLLQGWDETYRSWQHLANAGLVQGRYTGRYTEVVNGAGVRGVAVPGVNIPNGLYENTGWTLITLHTNSATNHEFGYTNGSTELINFIMLGGVNGADYAGFPTLNPGNSLQIDMKFDDGAPGTGNILAGPTTAWPVFNNQTCSTSSDIYTAQYRAVSNSSACILGWIISAQ